MTKTEPWFCSARRADGAMCLAAAPGYVQMPDGSKAFRCGPHMDWPESGPAPVAATPATPAAPSPAYVDLKIKKAAEKPPLDLIPLSALVGVARVFQHGATKYAAGNFLLAQDPEAPRRYAGALLRHMENSQPLDGVFTWESIGALDDESGLPDIDHAIASLIMVRAAAIRRGAMKIDPGMSKMLLAAQSQVPGGSL